MEKVSWSMITGDSMRVFGIGTQGLEKLLKNIPTATATSAATKMAKLMAKASTSGPMAKSMMVSGVRDLNRATVFGAVSLTTPI